MNYKRPKTISYEGSEIESIEASTGESVNIILTNGTFILISPTNRNIHDPDKDLLIEVFPLGINSLKE